MKPNEVRDIAWTCAKKDGVEQAIAILNVANAYYCTDNVREAISLLEKESQLLEEELQGYMD